MDTNVAMACGRPPVVARMARVRPDAPSEDEQVSPYRLAVDRTVQPGQSQAAPRVARRQQSD